MKINLQNSSNYNNQFQKEIEQNFSIPNKKVLVEISNSKVEFNISKNIKMSQKIKEIIDLDIGLSDVNYEINLISDTLWLNGTFVAQITFTRNTDSQVHINSIYIPFKNNSYLTYIYPPILPLNNEKKQYQFTNHEKESLPSKIFEQIIYYNNKPILDIISTKSVTSKSFNVKNGSNYLILDFNYELTYQIFQYQTISR